MIRTEVEVVVVAVSEKQEEANDVVDSCVFSISNPNQEVLFISAERDDIRAGDGFFPKYLRWYHPKIPPPDGSGAGPFGSFS